MLYAYKYIHIYIYKIVERHSGLYVTPQSSASGKVTENEAKEARAIVVKAAPFGGSSGSYLDPLDSRAMLIVDIGLYMGTMYIRLMSPWSPKENEARPRQQGLLGCKSP